MATDKSFFGRLNKLFSTSVIVRKQGNKLKVIDYDETQAIATNLRDRYMRLHSSAMNNTYENYLAYQQIRQELFRDYDAMDADPIIGAALDIYAEESTSKNEYGKVLEVRTNNEQIKSILENLFYDIINVEFNLFPWVRSLVKYGDHFLHIEIAEELGVVGIQPLSVYEITRVEGFDPNNWQAVKFVHTPLATKSLYVAGQKTEYENYEIAHFRMLTDTNFLPYGKSMLESARRLWKQITLMEDAMIIHRISRAPQKRIYKIDVGNIPTNEIDNYIQRIINKSKKTPLINADSGEYNLKYNIQNLMEDFYLPVRGNDSGTSIENLDGLEYAPIDDINYLKDKMFAALKIPKQHLGFLEDGNSKATLAAMDMRFAKTIERVQRIVTAELEKIAIIHLYSQGIEDETLADFELSLTIPYTIYEQSKIELWASKVDLARTMGDLKLISKDWVYKNVFNFSDDDVEYMKEGLVKDAKNLFVLTNLETTGKPEGQQEQGGMMAGQPEMGGEEQPAEDQPEEDEFPSGEPLDVEKTIQDLKSKLGQSPNEAKAAGRPRHVNRMGKDDHMYGRDAFGDKELKKLSRNNESFIKSIKKTLKAGGAKVIVEGKSMMDEQNIIE
jgi:hypothetical protein